MAFLAIAWAAILLIPLIQCCKSRPKAEKGKTLAYQTPKGPIKLNEKVRPKEDLEDKKSDENVPKLKISDDDVFKNLKINLPNDGQKSFYTVEDDANPLAKIGPSKTHLSREAAKSTEKNKPKPTTTPTPTPAANVPEQKVESPQTEVKKDVNTAEEDKDNSPKKGSNHKTGGIDMTQASKEVDDEARTAQEGSKGSADRSVELNQSVHIQNYSVRKSNETMMSTRKPMTKADKIKSNESKRKTKPAVVQESALGPDGEATTALERKTPRI
ncbi:unnamed protein product [Caenorhabditis auriculariae]|uniref:Uncharacterized protein n=1 Tax=Caenorhabditis auriculariae TaxID=2777116 RepID=A0A8S1HWJ9_9PELO|nr:unnamed protein product [Caenorhabditis auriculariae]